MSCPLHQNVHGLSNIPKFSWPVKYTKMSMSCQMYNQQVHSLTDAPRCSWPVEYTKMFMTCQMQQKVHSLSNAPKCSWPIQCTKKFMAVKCTKMFMACQIVTKIIMACQMYQRVHSLSYRPKYSWPVKWTKKFMACQIHTNVHVLSKVPKKQPDLSVGLTKDFSLVFPFWLTSYTAALFQAAIFRKHLHSFEEGYLITIVVCNALLLLFDLFFLSYFLYQRHLVAAFGTSYWRPAYYCMFIVHFLSDSIPDMIDVFDIKTLRI